jgi:hypothetical protein
MKVSDLLKSGISDQSVTPIIKAISPAKDRLGRSYALSIQGEDFHPWANVVFSNPGIIIEDMMVKDEKNIQMKITIKKKTEIGRTDVIVINPSGKGSVINNAFNIAK